MRNKPIYIFIITLLFFVNGVRANAEGEVKAEKVARELLEVSGASQFGPRVLDQMIAAQRKRMPDIPEKFWNDFRGEVNSDDFNHKVVPIYTKNLSVDEMEAIIRFYKTPVGKKLLKALPLISQETMKAGREYSMEIQIRIASRLKEVDLKELK